MYISAVIRPLVFLNIYIAFAAFCLHHLFYIAQINIPNSFTPLSFLLFFATVASYNLSRYKSLSPIQNTPQIEISTISKWLHKHQITYVCTIAIAILFSLFFISQIPLSCRYAIIALAIISFLYISPFPFANIRSIPFIKTWIIALIWAFSTSYLPHIYALDKNWNPDINLTHILFIENVFLIWAITIPFDIRDMSYDKKNKLKTFPNTIGIKLSKCISIFMLFFLLIIRLYRYYIYQHSYGFSLFFPLITILIIIWMIIQTNERKGELWYTLGIDGMIFIWVVSNIFASR